MEVTRAAHWHADQYVQSTSTYPEVFSPIISYKKNSMLNPQCQHVSNTCSEVRYDLRTASEMPACQLGPVRHCSFQYSGYCGFRLHHPPVSHPSFPRRSWCRSICRLIRRHRRTLDAFRVSTSNNSKHMYETSWSSCL